MPTTSSHGLPYPEGTDPAVVPDDVQALAEAVDSKLDNIAPAQIAGVAAGRLLIANGSGVVTGVAISGDATISNIGVLTIGDDKITRAKIADDAVGPDQLDTDSVTKNAIAANAVETSEIKDGAVTRAKTSGFIQTKRQAVTSLAGGSMAEITCVWDQPFPDTDYTAVANVFYSGSVTLLGLGVIRITERTASQIKVLVANNAAGALSGTVFALATAD